MTYLRVGILIAGAVVSLHGAQGDADDGRFEYSFDNAVDRSDPFIDTDVLEPEGASALETGLDSNTWLRFVNPVGGQRVWRFEQQARLRAFEDRDDLNSVLLTPRVQYWAPAGESWQLRAEADASVMMRDGERHYSRFQAEAQLRYRPQPIGDTVLRLRHTVYDFGSQVVTGLDQSQWRFGAEQHWFTANRSRGVRIAGFYTGSDADAERFSFQEWSLRSAAWTALGERTRGELRLDYYDRAYQDNFSVSQAFRREDTRLRASARLERQMGEHAFIYGEGGYVDNGSNIPTRAYSGGVFRVGFRLIGG